MDIFNFFVGWANSIDLNLNNLTSTIYPPYWTVSTKIGQ